jgi:hypothetical protein
MPSSSVHVTGIGEVKTRIDVIERRALAPGSQLWDSLGAFMRSVYAEQFRTEGAFLGTPWKPLKPASQLAKIRAGYRRGILVRTASLRDSFTKRGDSESISKSFGNYGDFGSSNRLAIFHQKGTHRNGKRAIPPRRIIVKTSYVTHGIKRITAEYIAHGRTSASRALG